MAAKEGRGGDRRGNGERVVLVSREGKNNKRWVRGFQVVRVSRVFKYLAFQMLKKMKMIRAYFSFGIKELILTEIFSIPTLNLDVWLTRTVNLNGKCKCSTLIQNHVRGIRIYLNVRGGDVHKPHSLQAAFLKWNH